jgi:hypothetical protein
MHTDTHLDTIIAALLYLRNSVLPSALSGSGRVYRAPPRVSRPRARGDTGSLRCRAELGLRMGDGGSWNRHSRCATARAGGAPLTAAGAARAF